MEVTFLGLEVTIPDDPVAFIKTKAIELLNIWGMSGPPAMRTCWTSGPSSGRHYRPGWMRS